MIERYTKANIANRRSVLGSIIAMGALSLTGPVLAGAEDRFVTLARLYNDLFYEPDHETVDDKSRTLFSFLETHFDGRDVADTQEVADAVFELFERVKANTDITGDVESIDFDALQRMQNTLVNVSVVFHLINPVMLPGVENVRRLNRIMTHESFHNWSKTYYPLLTVMMVGRRREEIYSPSFHSLFA